MESRNGRPDPSGCGSPAEPRHVAMLRHWLLADCFHSPKEAELSFTRGPARGASPGPSWLLPQLALRTDLVALLCGKLRARLGNFGMLGTLRGIALGVTVGGHKMCLGCILMRRGCLLLLSCFLLTCSLGIFSGCFSAKNGLRNGRPSRFDISR
jgi:hypothetical protein